MSENTLDAIDRYLKQMDELKELQRLHRENEELRNELQKARLEDPLAILKTIVQNRYKRSSLKKEWLDSGLVDAVLKEIDTSVHARVNIKLREYDAG